LTGGRPAAPRGRRASAGSYDPGAGANCVDCPGGADCPQGSTLATITAKEGYYRFHTGAEQFYECPAGDDACVGGTAGDAICREDAYGPLCKLCRPGTFRFTGIEGRAQCKSCTKETDFLWDMDVPQLGGGSLAAAYARALRPLVGDLAAPPPAPRVPPALARSPSKMFRRNDSASLRAPRKSQSRPTVQRFLDLALVAHDLNIRAQEKLKEGIRGVLAEVPGGAALK